MNCPSISPDPATNTSILRVLIVKIICIRQLVFKSSKAAMKDICSLRFENWSSLSPTNIFYLMEKLSSPSFLTALNLKWPNHSAHGSATQVEHDSACCQLAFVDRCPISVLCSYRMLGVLSRSLAFPRRHRARSPPPRARGNVKLTPLHTSVACLLARVVEVVQMFLGPFEIVYIPLMYRSPKGN